MRIECATADHFARWGLPPPRTVRAVAAVRDDGSVVGLAGFYADDYRLVMFADLTEEMRRNKRMLIKGTREVMRMAAARKTPVHAVADPEIAGSEALLTHLGFSRLQGSLFIWLP